jgi:redox-sensing transcriptional repressor
MTVTSLHRRPAWHPQVASERVVSRLILYRRLLHELSSRGVRCVFSHQIAKRANATPAQLRRDLMGIGSTGTPSRGYEVKDLEARISDYLAAAAPQRAALAGVGNLGRALLKYSSSRRASLHIVAALDMEPAQVEPNAGGCPCFHISEAAKVVSDFGVEVAIIAVPGSAAQGVANRLIEAGVQSLLNFSDARLRVPADVFVDHIDIDVSLEKFAFFARRNAATRE